MTSSLTSMCAYMAAVSGIGRHRLAVVQRSLAEHPEYIEELVSGRVDEWLLKTMFGFSSGQVAAYRQFSQKYSISDYYSYLREQNISVILLGQEKYPSVLASIYDPPIVLFVRGEVKPNELRVAVVGARKMTVYGELVLPELMPAIVAAGIPVVSGGMYGIDQTAHRTALEAGGRSYAVLGYGHGYLARHRTGRMLAHLETEGLVTISEYPPDTTPTKGTFVERNRIVSGLCQAVVLVEAAIKSGSLITADFALDQGREVGVVPGNMLQPQSAGCLQLIREGAALITSGEAVVNLVKGEAMPPHSAATIYIGEEDQQPAAAKILDALRVHGALSLAELSSTYPDLPHPQLLQVVSELELRAIVNVKHGIIQLASPRQI